ncbi:hypothetical protein [Leptospira kirschneri]|uniref:hypothetical protein n=1 Tax=Leptospira kirschneri TaxID=29507 RepID=UPI0002E88258|nr:hypothetical protein [Leptospira kirschneri]UML79569.1 hypothetical protein FH602_14880 [Leptospira kirschneri]
MGKNNSFRPKNSFLKFQVVFGFFLLSFVSLNSEEKSSILDPTFFLIHKNLNPSLGGLFETRKKFTSYGAWLELPVWKRERKHFWKTHFLYKNHKTFSVVHQTYVGLEYSFVPEKNDVLRLSVSVGWERGEKDLGIFGIHLTIPDKQTVQVFGKIGKDFKSGSVFLHSNFDAGLQLFLGFSRTWDKSYTEDQFTLGIGISWEKSYSSFFWNQTPEEESFLTGKFGITTSQQDFKSKTLFQSTDELGSNSILKSKNLDPRNTKSKSIETSLLEKEKTNHSYISSSIRSYTTISVSVQELLSAGFILSSALKISKASYSSKEEFLKLFHSLSAKEQTKIFVLLKKKNPKHIFRNSILSKDKR